MHTIHVYFNILFSYNFCPYITFQSYSINFLININFGTDKAMKATKSVRAGWPSYNGV